MRDIIQQVEETILEGDNMAEIDFANENSIGTVVSDETSPSFEIFGFKAKYNKYVTPGSLVATNVSDKIFLIGRVTSSHESNPHETSHKVTVRDTMEIPPDYPGEDMSLTIHRCYQVEVINEVKKTDKGYEVYPPEKMPKSGNNVFIPPQKVIMEVMGLEEDPKKSLNFGTIVVSAGEENKTPVRIKKDIIQRHVFIGGTTGSGKSYAAKVLAEEIHKHKLPIIFFDTQYEFAPLAEKLGGTVLVPGKNYKVKLSSLSEVELLDLIPTLKHELHVAILTRAFLRLKEGGHASTPRLEAFGTQPAERTRNTFGIQDLLDSIRQVANDMKAGQSTIDIVLDRTRHYLSSYNFIGEEFNWQEILKPGSIIDINCKEFGRQSLQLILASTLRELNELRKIRKINPYVIFIDEAHLFVPQDEDSPCKPIIRESVRIGRHHGICMVLITQSPMDIDKRAIRQCNTRLLFALEPDQLQSIQGVKADATQEMIGRLPKAPRGTCILSGTYETIKHSIPIQIRLMENPDADAGRAPDIFSEVGP